MANVGARPEPCVDAIRMATASAARRKSEVERRLFSGSRGVSLAIVGLDTSNASPRIGLHSVTSMHTPAAGAVRVFWARRAPRARPSVPNCHQVIEGIMPSTYRRPLVLGIRWYTLGARIVLYCWLGTSRVHHDAPRCALAGLLSFLSPHSSTMHLNRSWQRPRHRVESGLALHSIRASRATPARRYEQHTPLAP